MALGQSPLFAKPSRGRESPLPFPKGKKGPRRPAPAYEGLDGVGTKSPLCKAIEGERFSPNPTSLRANRALCSFFVFVFVPTRSLFVGTKVGFATQRESPPRWPLFERALCKAIEPQEILSKRNPTTKVGERISPSMAGGGHRAPRDSLQEKRLQGPSILAEE
jgi:hypothetical protein